jgi:hypothetical protein
MTLETPQISPYLTIIPDRAPRQKSHASLGQAKKAVLNRLSIEGLSTDIRVYKWADSGWQLLWEIKKGTLREEMPWMSLK